MNKLDEIRQQYNTSNLSLINMVFLLRAIEQLVRMSEMLLSSKDESTQRNYLSVLDPDTRELMGTLE